MQLTVPVQDKSKVNSTLVRQPKHLAPVQPIIFMMITRQTSRMSNRSSVPPSIYGVSVRIRLPSNVKVQGAIMKSLIQYTTGTCDHYNWSPTVCCCVGDHYIVILCKV